jgi:hypothetical protein
MAGRQVKASRFDTGISFLMILDYTEVFYCVATYSPSSLFFLVNGGSGSVNVSSATACAWEVWRSLDFDHLGEYR